MNLEDYIKYIHGNGANGAEAIAGHPGTDVCVFLSSKRIVEILKDIEYE